MHVCILCIYIYNALKSYNAMEHLRFWTLQFTPDRLFFFPYQSVGKEERCKSNHFQHFIGFGDPQRCVKSTPEPEIQPQTTFRNTWITSTLLWHLKTKARGRGNPFGKVSFLASSCSNFNGTKQHAAARPLWRRGHCCCRTWVSSTQLAETWHLLLTQKRWA